MILIENASSPIDSHDGEAATRACADVMAPVPEAGNEVENEPALAELVMQHGAADEERERGSSSTDFTPTPDRPVPAQKAATRRPLSFQFMEFGLIHSEHSLVRKIRSESGSRLRVLPTTIISESGLMELALQSPLHVTLEDGKFYCIGGLNFFRLMRYSLPGNFVIPVIVHEGYNSKKLRSHILFDLFLTPVLSSLDMNDRRLMGAIWTKLQDEEVFSRTLEFKSSDALSALLNCDRRTAGNAPRVAGKTPITAGKSSISILKPSEEAISIFKEDTAYIGNRLCPTLKTVQEAVQNLQFEIRRSARPKTDAGYQRHHNLVTLYTLLMFSYTTGVRGIATPYIDFSEIGPLLLHTAPALLRTTLTDKDSGVGYKTRLVRITPMLFEQMNFYNDLVSRSPQIHHSSGLPCFFLDDALRPVEVRPRTIVPIMREFLPFPVNIHRRFVSSALLDAGCPPEVVSAWMGHWHRGEEPWGKYSSFSFGDFAQVLGVFLDPLLKHLKFVPIRAYSRPRGWK